MVLTERAFEAYTGAPTTQAPDQTQSSDLLDSPNGVGPIFFMSAPSSLALSPLVPAPSTVQHGYRPCVAVTVGPGSRLWGANGANGACLQPSPVWGTGGHCLGLSGLSSCYPPRRVIAQSWRGKRQLPTVLCRPRVAVSVSVLTWYAEIWSRHSQEKPNTLVSSLEKEPAKCTMHRCCRRDTHASSRCNKT